MASVSIKNLTRHSMPRFSYKEIVETLLPDWDISFVFIPPQQAKRINLKLRKKTYVPNVLSYPAGESSGEILICPTEAKRQAPEYQMSERIFILYLFIHALLHLKGWDHGVNMERCEQELLTKFSTITTRSKYGSENSNRHRYRHLPSQNRSGRRNKN